MKIARLSLVAVLAMLAGCQSSTGTNTNPINAIADPLITVLSRLSNTAAADLTTAQNVANAATPKDTDGANCAGAALTAQGQVNAVITAAHVPTAGAFTVGELASLFQPGSQQYNLVKQELVSGCAAKAQDVMGPAALLGTGVIGALAVGQTVLPLAAAAP
jgi:hypothetical protein